MKALPLLCALSLLGPAGAMAVEKPVAAKSISVEHHGRLGDALRKIATAGKLNLVIPGDLDMPVDVVFADIPAEDALRSLAKAHGLIVVSEASVLTLERASVPGPGSPGMPRPPGHPAPPPPHPTPSNDESGDNDDHVDDETIIASHTSSDGKGPDVQVRVRLKDLKDIIQAKHVTIEADQKVPTAISMGSGVDVHGHVEKDVVAMGGDIHLWPGSVVRGSATSMGGDVIVDKGATLVGKAEALGGSVIRRDDPQPHRGDGDEAEHDESDAADTMAVHDNDDEDENPIVWSLIWFAVLYFIAFLTTSLMPQRVAVLQTELQRDAVKNTLVGVCVAVALVPLTIALVLTIIGIAFIPFLWAGVAAAIAMGVVAAASLLGTKLLERANRVPSAVALALGVAIVIVIAWVPVAGVLALITLSFWSLGAVVRTRFGTRGPSSGTPTPPPVEPAPPAPPPPPETGLIVPPFP